MGQNSEVRARNWEVRFASHERTWSAGPVRSVSCIATLRRHSITSSARATTDGGRSRPSAFAVFRLMTSWYLVGACTGRSAGLVPALISAIMGHAGAAPTSASSSSKARMKLPGGPRRGLGLSQIGRQMPALLSFTFLDLKCGSASSRAVPPV